MIAPPDTLKTLMRILILALVVGLFLVVPGQVVHAGDNGGSALDFNGTTDYVETGTAASLNMSGSSFTIELWIWGDSSLSYTQERVLVEYGATFDTGTYQLTTRNDGNFKVNFHGRSSVDGSNANVDWSDSQWHHLAGVFDNSDNTLKTYFDGILQDTTTETNAPGDANLALYLASRGGTEKFSDVILDEVRIWNTARTPAQIQDNMFQELAGGEGGLVAYYKLNDGSGSTATDSAGSNNGTLNGSPAWVSSTAPIGTLTYTADPAALWGGQTDTSSDGQITGLDIADAGFLIDTGDDIVFGHNGAAYANVTANVSGGGRDTKRWDRLWELDVNDVGSGGGNVELTFDISDAGGTGSFSDAGIYYLLKRATGSSDAFTAVVQEAAYTVSGDRLTLTVDAANLGSEFTLGASATSPTAVGLRNLNAGSGNPFGQIPDTLPLVLWGLVALVALASGGLVLSRRRK